MCTCNLHVRFVQHTTFLLFNLGTKHHRYRCMITQVVDQTRLPFLPARVHTAVKQQQGYKTTRVFIKSETTKLGKTRSFPKQPHNNIAHPFDPLQRFVPSAKATGRVQWLQYFVFLTAGFWCTTKPFSTTSTWCGQPDQHATIVWSKEHCETVFNPTTSRATFSATFQWISFR